MPVEGKTYEGRIFITKVFERAAKAMESIVAEKKLVRATKARIVVFDEHGVLPELSRVRAIREIEEAGERVPVGATGTVVHVIKGGIGYDVEFTVPRHIVISASRDELAPA